MKPHRNAITLVELMVGLVLIALVMLGLSNIEMFSRSLFMNTDKKIKLESDLAFVVQHMNKNIAKGIADTSRPAIDTSPIEGAGANQSVQVWIDSQADGILNDSCPSTATVPLTGGDARIAYVYNNTSHKLFHYPDYNSAVGCNPALNEYLAGNIKDFRVMLDKPNLLRVFISSCFNVSLPCGTRDNPQVNLTTYILLPSVTAESP